jgi:hypothetical protein
MCRPLRSGQDDLQPVCALEPPWRVQQDFAELVRKAGKPSRLMIDATHLKAHCTAASLLKKRGYSPTYRAHQRGLEFEAACRLRRPGTADHHAAQRRRDERFKGAALMSDVRPPAKQLLGDKGYDANSKETSDTMYSRVPRMSLGLRCLLRIRFVSGSAPSAQQILRNSTTSTAVRRLHISGQTTGPTNSIREFILG